MSYIFYAKRDPRRPKTFLFPKWIIAEQPSIENRGGVRRSPRKILYDHVLQAPGECMQRPFAKFRVKFAKNIH